MGKKEKGKKQAASNKERRRDGRGREQRMQPGLRDWFQARTDLALEERERFPGDGGEVAGVVLKEKERDIKRAQATAESDIDIMVESGEIDSYLGLGRLYMRLNEALQKDIDLVPSDAGEGFLDSIGGDLVPIYRRKDGT